MGKITQTNIAEELASRNQFSKEDADNFLSAVMETIKQGLRDDNMVKIKGLGTFKLMEMSDRESIDVNTGERITIKGYTKVTFTPDSSMKEFVNRPFAHFEPTELNDGYPEEEMAVNAEDTLEEATLPSTEELEEAITEEAQEVAETEVVKEDEPTPSLQETVQDTVVSTEMTESDEITEEVSESLEVVSDGDAPEAIESVETIEVIQTSESPETTDSSESIEEDTEEHSAETNDIDSDIAGEVESNIETEQQEKFVSEEESIIDNPTDRPTEEESISPQTEPTSPKTDVVDKKEKKKGKKKAGCMGIGCLVVLLLFVVAIVAYFSPRSTMIGDLDLFEEDKFENSDQGEIKVNPNLNKELGLKRNSEVATPAVAPDTIAEPVKETAVEEVSVVPEEAVTTPSEEVKSSLLTPEVKPATTTSAAHTLVITESLAAKSIKDITIADTTEYSINGTQTTHTLQDGETIIQLSRKYYGDKRLWPYIVKYNNITDFNKVSVGMKINIPLLKNKAVE